MYPTSTQRSHWTFSNEDELQQSRREANQRFIIEQTDKYTNNKDEDDDADDKKKDDIMLTVTEEFTLLRHYEFILKEFCSRFQPPMPRCVVNTAMVYMKRVYLHHSLMDFHPRDMMLTCIYMACKVEEFNVSIVQFVNNLKGDRERFADLILSCELLLMQLLHYHLTVHHPNRPLEGFIIDVKTRCPEIAEKIDASRKSAENFIDRSLNTDVCLQFSPSQIALAALLHSAKKSNLNLDNYVTNILIGGAGSEEGKLKLPKLIQQIKKIRHIVGHIEPLNREKVRSIEQKLEKCRNAENNPSSEAYKRKMEEKVEKDEERQTSKRQRLAEADRQMESETLGGIS